LRRIALSHRVVRNEKIWGMIMKLLTLYPELEEVSIGVEREDYPVPKDAELEEIGDSDEEVRELKGAVERLKGPWEEMFLKKGWCLPVLKVVEIRPRRQSWNLRASSFESRPMGVREALKETTVGVWQSIKLLYLMRRFLREDIFEIKGAGRLVRRGYI